MKTSKYSWTVGIVGASLMLACVGDDPGTGGGNSSGEPGSSSGSPGSSSGEPGSSSGEPGSSSGEPGSSSGASSGGTPGRSCEGDELVEGSNRTTCELGCRAATDTEGARCKVFDPNGPAGAADLLRAGLGALTLEEGDELDVTSGRIRRGETLLRQANESGEDQLRNNVAFRVQNGVAIFVARSITITGNLTWVGTEGATTEAKLANHPVVLVAQDELKIEATLVLPCGRLGGYAGGQGQAMTRNGLGPGGGGHKAETQTGSGGGHGTRGGGGGGVYNSGGTLVGGPGGGILANGTFVLEGGSGGGAGSIVTPGDNAFAGGDGGAALALIAGRTLTLGSGASGQGVNAGGCGAESFNITGRTGHSGGGGGAGGFLALEAPRIIGAAGAGLAANGGGGAGWEVIGGETRTRAGQDGALSTSPAAGGGGGGDPISTCLVKGGDGGAATSAGQPGTSVASTCTASSSRAGGGGGGLGRIAVGTANGGTITTEVGSDFFVSPSATPALQRFALSPED